MLSAAEIIMRRCDELATFSEEPNLLFRRYGVPAMRDAQRLIQHWMEEAGLEVRRDALGNQFGRREASSPGGKTLIIGSHIDSVRDAGRYDGPLGALTSIAVADALRNHPLPFALEVVAFAEEEGSRFPVIYVGSKAAIGALDAEALASTDRDGIRLDQAIRDFGGDPERLAETALAPEHVIGYIETHIEQGPLLEAKGLPVGVVTNIIGSGKGLVTFRGIAGHAGTVPMALRHDALCAAAEWVLAVERIGRETPGLVATVGQLSLAPGSANVIPAEVRMSLDIRHAENTTWSDAIDRAFAEARAIAERRSVQVETSRRTQNDSVAMNQTLVETLARSIAASGVEPLRMVSGAGHDAATMSRITPAAMLFVRCKGGISHNPAESITTEDAAVAVDVLTRAVLDLADQHS